MPQKHFEVDSALPKTFRIYVLINRCLRDSWTISISIINRKANMFAAITPIKCANDRNANKIDLYSFLFNHNKYSFIQYREKINIEQIYYRYIIN